MMMVRRINSHARPALQAVWPFALAVIGCLTPWNSCAQQQRVIAGYFTEWSVFSRDFHVRDIPAELVTHVFYAHLKPVYNETEGTGSVDFFNREAAIERTYPGDTDELPFKGNLNQLLKLKAAYPQVKTLVSIGGETLSADFSDIAASELARSTFVDSCVDFILAYGFDGIDLNWEFPVEGGAPEVRHRPEDAHNLVLLTQSLRQRLDEQAASDGRDYLLTAAVSATPDTLDLRYELPVLSESVDWLNVMAYRMAGPWDPVTGHQASLYGHPEAYRSEFSVAASLTRFLNLTVPREKLVLGVPFYGLGFRAVPPVDAGLFETHEGATETGTWSPGVFDFRDLRDGIAGDPYIGANGYELHWDPISQVPFLYNPQEAVFITYEDERSAARKAAYVLEHNLRGMMYWSFDADTRDRSLGKTLKQTLDLVPYVPESAIRHVVGDVDFDEALPAWSYAYTYAGYGGADFRPALEVVIPPEDLPYEADLASPAGVGGSNAFEAQGDFTALPEVGVETNEGDLVEWNYGGLGLGAGMAKVQFTSARLRDYTFSFAASVTGGLTEGLEVASALCKLEIQAPDNTLMPGDEDAEADDVLVVAYEFTAPQTEWTDFAFRLDEAVIEVGSEALFGQYLTNLTQVNVNFNFGSIPEEFGTDAGNSVIIDNLALTLRPPQELPSYYKLLSKVDFESTDPPYTYGYAYGGYDAVDVSDQLNPTTGLLEGSGVDQSRALANYGGRFSVVRKVPPAKSNYGGMGLGLGLPFHAESFDSARLSDYVLRFDLRAAGVAPGVEQVETLQKLQFEAFDGTLDPGGPDGEFDVLLSMELPGSASASFRTVTLPLDKMVISEGSLTQVMQHLNQLTNITVDVQCTRIPGDFECDDDNGLFVDNVQLLRRVTGLPALEVDRTLEGVLLSWEGIGQLEWASAIGAEWVPVPGALSPHAISIGSGTGFYRLKVEGPP